MDWVQSALNRLASMRKWGYHSSGATAAEPAALAALALLAHHRPRDAARPLAWLTAQQATDGSVGVTDSQSQPAWTTALAILAWLQADSAHESRYGQIKRAVEWLLVMRGDPLAQSADLGHDSTLIGWPWVRGTHSWIEPTAWSVAALKAAGYAAHPRVREGVRLLIDRLLPGGGCNYGNTFVLGQALRPHMQPSGAALLALAGERDDSGRMQRTIGYVLREIGPDTTTSSLCHALLGLVAHGQRPVGANGYLAKAYQRTLARDGNAYHLALLLLAQSRANMVSPKQMAVS